MKKGKRNKKLKTPQLFRLFNTDPVRMQALLKEADSQNRSVSNLVETICIEYLDTLK